MLILPAFTLVKNEFFTRLSVPVKCIKAKARLLQVLRDESIGDIHPSFANSLEQVWLDLSKPQSMKYELLYEWPESDGWPLDFITQWFPNLWSLSINYSMRMWDDHQISSFYHFLTAMSLPPHSKFSEIMTWINAFGREKTDFTLVAENLEIEVLTHPWTLPNLSFVKAPELGWEKFDE